MMKRIASLIVLMACYQQSVVAQITRQYRKTLHLTQDTIFTKFSDQPATYRMQVSADDTLYGWGTDGVPGLTATIYGGKNTLKIANAAFPNPEVVYVPVQTPTRKFIYTVHFNAPASIFTESYRTVSKGNVRIEVPEVYELANIIWTLSPAGQRATNLYKQGEYYQRVSDYFKPYMNHPVFKQLDFPDSSYMKNYYDFRENSFAFSFSKNKLVREGPYYYVWGNDYRLQNSLFRDLIPLIEDFARKSKYRQFYKDNQAYYARKIEEEKNLLPVNNMWIWLEGQFPREKFDTYKIVFSPLISASHSTQQFNQFLHDSNPARAFREIVMFVCGPDVYNAGNTFTSEQKEGLMSGIVFTEIDHNYVNPLSDRYSKQIDSAFTKRGVWVKEGGDGNLYGNTLAVFNEYMTHAAFCAYVEDTYPKETADFLISSRINLMVNTRKFIRFKAFSDELLRLRKENPGKTLTNLYPQLIRWCRQQS